VICGYSVRDGNILELPSGIEIRFGHRCVTLRYPKTAHDIYSHMEELKNGYDLEVGDDE